MDFAELSQEEIIEHVLSLMRAANGTFNLHTGVQTSLFKENQKAYIALMNRMLHMGLYKPHDINNQHIGVLTPYGWEFEGFAKEKKKREREDYMKKNAYWRAKYWWAIAIAGYLGGFLSPDSLKETVKSLFQEQPKTETTKSFSAKKEYDTSNHK